MINKPKKNPTYMDKVLKEERANSVKDQYQEYLSWFKAKVKTADGVREMAKKSACDFGDPTLPPQPFPFGIWALANCNNSDLKKVLKLKKPKRIPIKPEVTLDLIWEEIQSIKKSITRKAS